MGSLGSEIALVRRRIGLLGSGLTIVNCVLSPRGGAIDGIRAIGRGKITTGCIVALDSGARLALAVNGRKAIGRPRVAVKSSKG